MNFPTTSLAPQRSNEGILVSFILCSRNDTYMGDPVARLATAINYLAKSAETLGLLGKVEVLVADWGSKTPLREVVRLTAASRQITRFLEVPVELAKAAQKDSPFAEVLALNAVALRSRGTFIGRIDQDTLVGRRFFQWFESWNEPGKKDWAKYSPNFLFSQRRQIPFRIANLIPSLGQIERLLAWTGSRLLIEVERPFFDSPVGIMLLHRDLWWRAGGYDERLLYWGWMETDLAHRLKSVCAIIDIGPATGCDFYHLEHYDPSTPRKTPRQKNARNEHPAAFKPNSEDWGFAREKLTFVQVEAGRTPEEIPCAPGLSIPGEVVRLHGAFLGRTIVRGFRIVTRLIGAVGRPARYKVYLDRVLIRLRLRQAPSNLLAKIAPGLAP